MTDFTHQSNHYTFYMYIRSTITDYTHEVTHMQLVHSRVYKHNTTLISLVEMQRGKKKKSSKSDFSPPQNLVSSTAFVSLYQ